MGTLYSDIYIDGMNTEILAAEGTQIKEAWLDGECIWKLVDKFEKAVHVVIWAKCEGEYYGFGIYPLADKPPYLSNRWGRVYFKGEDPSDMNIEYVTVGNGVNDLFYNNFSVTNPVSVYGFGLCIFPSRAYSVNTVTYPNIKILPGHSISSTEISQGVQLCDVLGEEFVNIADPMGVYCNVFNDQYQIRGSSSGKSAEIYDMVNKTITYANFAGESNCTACATGMCAYTAGKIFFVPKDNTVQGLYTQRNIPLYYIEESNLDTIKEIEINISAYMEPDSESENGYSLLYVYGSGIDAANSKVVFGLTLTFTAIGITGKTVTRHILVKYERGFVSCEKIVLPENASSPSFLGMGIKIIGKYILICHYGVDFWAGTTISNMQQFRCSSGRPHVFYEENGELYCDEIYTYEGLSSQVPVPSVIIKNRVNFDTGTVEVISETEINGRLEE